MEHFARVRSAARALGSATAGELAFVAKLDECDCRAVADALVQIGHAKAAIVGPKRRAYTLSRYVLHASANDVAALFRGLDTSRRSKRFLVVGEGHKHHDCVHYDGCMSDFAHEHGDETDGHCPRGCAHFQLEAPSPNRLMHEAVSRRCT